MSAREIARRMQQAAVDFLDSLDPDQRDVAQWPFTATDERETWFYTPTDHGGLALSQMRPLQHKHAYMLLAEGLSEPGYYTTAAVIGLDNMLDRLEGFHRDWGRERGRDPGLYYWRVFGDPRSEDPWSWRVGGHHVSIQHVVVDGAVVGSTPLFLGADPASVPLLGPTPHRPLGAVEDLAFEIMASLTADQRTRAVLGPVAPTDIVAGNRTAYQAGDGPMPLADIWRGRLPDPWHDLAVDLQAGADAAAGLEPAHLDAVRLTDKPAGLPASAMDAGQQDALRRLLSLYADRLPGPLAALERAKFADGRVAELAWAWAGGVIPGDGYYYRVQGPDLLVECDNTQRGANHIHTVWRDPYRDFGRDPLAAHYQAMPHAAAAAR